VALLHAQYYDAAGVPQVRNGQTAQFPVVTAAAGSAMGCGFFLPANSSGNGRAAGVIQRHYNET
jgi:hypothetical protein